MQNNPERAEVIAVVENRIQFLTRELAVLTDTRNSLVQTPDLSEVAEVKRRGNPGKTPKISFLVSVPKREAKVQTEKRRPGRPKKNAGPKVVAD